MIDICWSMWTFNDSEEYNGIFICNGSYDDWSEFKFFDFVLLNIAYGWVYRCDCCIVIDNSGYGYWFGVDYTVF